MTKHLNVKKTEKVEKRCVGICPECSRKMRVINRGYFCLRCGIKFEERENEK